MYLICSVYYRRVLFRKIFFECLKKACDEINIESSGCDYIFLHFSNKGDHVKLVIFVGDESVVTQVSSKLEHVIEEFIHLNPSKRKKSLIDPNSLFMDFPFNYYEIVKQNNLDFRLGAVIINDLNFLSFAAISRLSLFFLERSNHRPDLRFDLVFGFIYLYMRFSNYVKSEIKFDYLINSLKRESGLNDHEYIEIVNCALCFFNDEKQLIIEELNLYSHDSVLVDFVKELISLDSNNNFFFEVVLIISNQVSVKCVDLLRFVLISTYTVK